MKVIKMFLRSRWSTGIVGFGLGILCMIWVQKGQSYSKPSLVKDPLVLLSERDDPFFAQDPLQEMQKIRERMFKHLDNEKSETHSLGTWFRKRTLGASSGEIKKREDDQFVYYDISIAGLDKEKLNIKVEGGQVSVSGQVVRKSGDQNSEDYFTSSFYRSFPLPDDVDPKQVQMDQKQDQLIVRFPKVKPT